MRKISLAVFIPERAAVDKTFFLHHPGDRFPRTTRVLCLGHEESLVRIATVDIEPSVVIAYRGCPHVVTMLNLLAPIQFGALVFRQNRIVIE
jgi:hypothetical protein